MSNASNLSLWPVQKPDAALYLWAGDLTAEEIFNFSPTGGRDEFVGIVERLDRIDLGDADSILSETKSVPGLLEKMHLFCPDWDFEARRTGELLRWRFMSEYEPGDERLPPILEKAMEHEKFEDLERRSRESLLWGRSRSESGELYDDRVGSRSLFYPGGIETVPGERISLERIEYWNNRGELEFSRSIRLSIRDER